MIFYFGSELCMFLGSNSPGYMYLVQVIKITITFPSCTCIIQYVIMSTVASQITSVSIVCSTVVSGADQRKHQSSASLAGEFPTQKASNAENASIWWRLMIRHLYKSPQQISGIPIRQSKDVFSRNENIVPFMQISLRRFIHLDSPRNLNDKVQNRMLAQVCSVLCLFLGTLSVPSAFVISIAKCHSLWCYWPYDNSVNVQYHFPCSRFWKHLHNLSHFGLYSLYFDFIFHNTAIGLPGFIACCTTPLNMYNTTIIIHSPLFIVHLQSRHVLHE